MAKILGVPTCLFFGRRVNETFYPSELRVWVPYMSPLPHKSCSDPNLGSLSSVPSIRQSVPQSVSQSVRKSFHGSSHEKFSTFCMKLGINKRNRLTKPDFWKKNYFAQNWSKCAKNGPEMRFLVLEHVNYAFLKIECLEFMKVLFSGFFKVGVL